MRLLEATKIVVTEVIPKLSGKDQIAVAVVVDFVRKVLPARAAVGVLYKAFFEHVNQTELFDDDAETESTER